MKAADVSHAAMEWTVHQKLSMDINEELWAQVNSSSSSTGQLVRVMQRKN